MIKKISKLTIVKNLTSYAYDMNLILTKNSGNDLNVFFGFFLTTKTIY